MSIITPSLNLPASAGLLPPQLSFTRASAATQTNACGKVEIVPAGVLRHDFDPLTGEYRGWLIEEQRTNLLTYSEQFDLAAWTKVNCSVTANAIAAPDGATSCDYITGSGSPARINQSITVGTNTTYVFSCFLKYGNNPWVNINLADGAGNGKRLWVNVQTGGWGTTQNIGAGLTAGAPAAQWYPNGYLRIAIPITTGGTNNVLTCELLSAMVDGSTTSTLGATLNMWGAQVEAGAFATSYIPTTTASATRNADVLTVPTSSFAFNASEGTLFVQAEQAPVQSESYRFGYALLSDGTLDNVISFDIDIDYHLHGRVNSGGVEQANFGQFPGLAGSPFKAAMAYGTNGFACCVNGGAVASDTAGVVPSGLSTFHIGWASPSGWAANCHIRHVAYFPRRLSNVDLQAITS